MRFADEHEPDLIDKVRALRPLLRSQARAGEAARSMTDPVFRALDDLRIWWMLLPRRWGGYGMSSGAMSRVNREIAKGDPSVAWVVQIINGTSWISSLSCDALQEDLFGKGAMRICSSFAVAGQARPAAGGYIVNGLWPYNSGSRQSDWGQYLVSIHHDDGRVVPGNWAYVEMKDVEIVDSWYSAGMQGTSSDSARITEYFIPEHRMVVAERPFSCDVATRRHAGEPSDYLMNMPTIRSAGLGLQLGAVEAAVELAIETAQSKGVPTTSYARQAESSVVQRNLGEAASRVHAVKLIVDGLTSTLDGYAMRREMPPLHARALNKAQCSLAVQLLTQAIDMVMHTAGSSAFGLDNPLQRFWRDVNVAARHAIYNPEVGYEVYGRSLLGIEPNIMPPGLI